MTVKCLARSYWKTLSKLNYPLLMLTTQPSIGIPISATKSSAKYTRKDILNTSPTKAWIQSSVLARWPSMRHPAISWKRKLSINRRKWRKRRVTTTFQYQEWICPVDKKDLASCRQELIVQETTLTSVAKKIQTKFHSDNLSQQPLEKA